MRETIKYNQINIIKEFSNSNRTKVAVLGTYSGHIVVYEFEFDRDSLYGNTLKRFEAEGERYFCGKDIPMNREEAEETYGDLVKNLQSYCA